MFRLLAAAVVAALAVPGAACASQLIDRNASDVHLLVARDGMALLQYRTRRRRSGQVAVWGAIDARAPNPSLPQVKFRLDYSGRTWKKRKGSCRPYDGPELAWFVTGCTAADGSYWTVQSWQRVLPDLGFTPWLPAQTAWELHVSHWTGRDRRRSSSIRTGSTTAAGRSCSGA